MSLFDTLPRTDAGLEDVESGISRARNYALNLFAALTRPPKPAITEREGSRARP